MAASLESCAALLDAGKIDAAENIARSALQAAPDDINALGTMAAVMAQRSRLVEACALADRVAASHDARADQLCAAAEINRRAGRDSVALVLAEMACQAEPGLLPAWILRAMSLESLGCFGEAYEAYRHAISLDPANRNLHSTMLYMLYVSGIFPMEKIAEEHRAWASLHADPLMPAVPRHANGRQPERLLKIGYVSPDFRRHVVGDFVEPVLAHHDRSAFTVFCYFSSMTGDGRTPAFRKLADVWRDVSRMADDETADLIRADSIDILVDLSGHTRGNRLAVFARKPAPLQMSWLGYLGTTGMKAMDYCITDDYTDPPGGSGQQFVEQLLRLPATQWCYAAPGEPPPVSALPALKRGHVTFGSFSNYGRLNAETFQAWARVLNAVPGSRLRIAGATGGDPTDRLFQAMDEAAVSVDRIELCARTPYRDYLEGFSTVDIALGAFPYTGATTTCEALWMGVPLVCRSGSGRAARSSAGILTALGFPEFVAEDWDRYCATAAAIASDLSSLARLRANLRERMQSSPLMDAEAFTRNLEAVFRSAWRNWCLHSPATAHE